MAKKQQAIESLESNTPVSFKRVHPDLLMADMQAGPGYSSMKWDGTITGMQDIIANLPCYYNSIAYGDDGSLLSWSVGYKPVPAVSGWYIVLSDQGVTCLENLPE